MLSTRIRTIARGGRRWVRYNSGASAVSYASQVRAYPFAFDKEEAIKRASLPASVVCATEILKSLCAYFLGTTPIQPLQVAAVYLPGWIIDAQVEARIWQKKGEEESKKPTTVHAQFKNSYMPGFFFDPLSQFSLKDYDDLSDLPTNGVPWSPALATQHGMDITCLPFTMTPFSLVDAARSRPYNKKFVIRYDPESIEEVLLAAYPILMPVYLLQYEVERLDDQPSEQAFVIVDASTKDKGRMASENPIPRLSYVMPKSFREPLEFLGKFALLQYDRANFTPRVISNWAKLKATVPFNIGTKLSKGIDLSLDMLAFRSNAWQRYMNFDVQRRKAATGTEEIDWTDLRIRTYSEEEVTALWNYLRELSTAMSLHTLNSTLSNALDDKTSGQMSEIIAKELKKAKDLKPDWVKALAVQKAQKTISDDQVSESEKGQDAPMKLEEKAEPRAETTQAGKPTQANLEVKASDKGSSGEQKK